MKTSLHGIELLPEWTLVQMGGTRFRTWLPHSIAVPPCDAACNSYPYVDVALVGIREPRFVELNHEISHDVASRIDLAKLYDRYVR